MVIKNKNVRIEKIHNEISSRFGDLDLIMNIYTGRDVVITSGHEGFSGDGVHKINSKHYIVDRFDNIIREYGQAIDIRSYTVKNSDISKCLEDLKNVFSYPNFTILFEKDHYHIQLNW